MRTPCGPNPSTLTDTSFHLRTKPSFSWKVFALFNHDLEQAFISATEAPKAQIRRECDKVASELVDWEKGHRIDRIEVVGEFPTLRQAQMYAGWLKREGAFEGAEDYAIGVDDALQLLPVLGNVASASAHV